MRKLFKVVLTTAFLFVITSQMAHAQVDVCDLLKQMQSSVSAMGTKGKPYSAKVDNAYKNAQKSSWSPTKGELTGLLGLLNSSKTLSDAQKNYLKNLADQAIAAIDSKTACCGCTTPPPPPSGTCNISGFWKSPSYSTSFAQTQGISGDWEFRNTYSDDAVGHWNGRWSDGNDWIFFDWQIIPGSTNDILRITLVGEGNSNSGVPFDAVINACNTTTLTLTVGGETNSFTR